MEFIEVLDHRNDRPPSRRASRTRRTTLLEAVADDETLGLSAVRASARSSGLDPTRSGEHPARSLDVLDDRPLLVHLHRIDADVPAFVVEVGDRRLEGVADVPQGRVEKIPEMEGAGVAYPRSLMPWTSWGRSISRSGDRSGRTRMVPVSLLTKSPSPHDSMRYGSGLILRLSDDILPMRPGPRIRCSRPVAASIRSLRCRLRDRPRSTVAFMPRRHPSEGTDAPTSIRGQFGGNSASPC